VIGSPGRYVPSGYRDNTSRPDNDITRAQTTRMTCRLVGTHRC